MNTTKDFFSMLISNLKIWQSKAWVKYTPDPVNLVLKIHYDQLLIILDSKVLESINCSGKIKGINKEDNVILIIGTTTNEVRKIKFQIKQNVAENLRVLGRHFTIINYNDHLPGSTIKRYNRIDEYIDQALGNNEYKTNLPLPSTYNNFIKLCLLDPAFPQIVIQTQEILRREFGFKT